MNTTTALVHDVPSFFRFLLSEMKPRGKLLRLAGRKKVVGKPFLYRTSKEFLVHFGLDRAEDLPDPEEMVKDESTSVD